MKSASSALASHLSESTTTTAWLWRVTRKDGAVYGFTSHDQDITIGGTTYAAATGFSASAARARLGASVDGLDLSGAISGDAITTADILAGVWDGADVVISICNWADTSQGAMTIQTGTLGAMQLAGDGYVCEIRSLSQGLNNTVGRVLTRRCDANLGDARCGVNLASYTVTGTATADSPDWQSFAADSLPASIGGLLTWTSGANDGHAIEVKTASGVVICLRLPMPSAISAGDAYTVTAGCDKNLSTCRDTFGNVKNFRGCPHIPGPDAVQEYPDAA
jgi:uncharacterized phage protein (TIGR02218 family)